AAGTIPLALKQSADDSTTPGLALFETASGDLGYIGAKPSTLVIGAASTRGLAFNVSGSTTAMTIKPTGQVGIGTSNPLATLDVNGGIRGNSLTAPTDLFVNVNGRIAIRTSPSPQYLERVSILNNGNVGIGTTTPTSRLTVI